MMTKNKLSDTLKRLMFEKDIRAVELARQTNLPQPTVQRMVVGTTPNPQLTSLEPIAKYFGITIEQLRGNEPITWLQTAVSVNLTQIPVMAWEQAQQWQQLRQNFQITGKTELIWAEKKNEPTSLCFEITGCFNAANFSERYFNYR